MASTACPFREGGQKDVFSILASVFAFSRASFGNSVSSRLIVAQENSRNRKLKKKTQTQAKKISFPAFLGAKIEQTF